MKKRNQNGEISGIGGTSYVQTDEGSVIDANHIDKNSGDHQIPPLNRLTQIEENNENFYDHTIAEQRFNEIEVSQNLREPKFCFFIPLAKGVCCGLISLKVALISIAVLDIIIGIVWISLGAQLYVKSELNSAYAVTIAVNVICLILAIISLIAIAKKKISYLKYYFIWKCAEILLQPLISIFTIISAKNTQTQEKSNGEYVLIIVQTMLRLYIVYLIYSFCKRLDRGEILLIEYGGRRLSRMIEELRADQKNMQWELELTERANSARI